MHRQSELGGRSEMEGTWPNGSYALARAHLVKFELDFKKNGLRKKVGSSLMALYVGFHEDRGNKNPRNVGLAPSCLR